MKNLYIVESPLQALCALEVSLDKDKTNEENFIIIKLSNGDRKKNDNQILDILNQRKWSKKKIIVGLKIRNVVTNNFFQRRVLDSIRNDFYDDIDNLYLGEFRSIFMHLAKVAVEADNVFIMDDGAASINTINRYIKNNKYYPHDNFLPKNKIKKIVFRLIYKKYINKFLLDKPAVLLTAFHSKDEKNIKRIYFKESQKKINTFSKKDKNLVFYFGSKYSEANIISLEYEIEFLTEVKKFYGDKNLVYFPHRDESEEKLKVISEDIGFKLSFTNSIAELYIMQCDKSPQEVAGAYTSVLNNVNVIFPEITCRAFKLDSKRIDPSRLNIIESVYSFYKSTGINIQEL
ncbi:hypothetical protein [Psychrobacter aestuarii]|uniref:Uncharacterized protein n=1 Tax=Psychrobacter aestuarii TaxID=556327 RepID=A0ABP3FMS6_9GAMM|nr:hypothetical protein [Psychrobacter aestuarii]